MTPEEQYRANLAFLATRPQMQDMLAQLDAYPLTNMQLIPGNQGYLFGQVWDTATQQWYALCSAENPVDEAIRDCENLYTRDGKIFTLFGMGLGYFVVEFAKRLQPWQRLAIWDVDPTMFKAMLYAVDVSPLFSDKRTDVRIGNDVPNQVESWWLSLDAVEKLYMVLPFRASYTNGPGKDQYDAMMEKSLEMVRFHHVGLSTWKIFGSCIGDNDLENMPEYFTTPGITTLKDLWKDKPAVCVAAGPSLQKNLRHLLASQVRDRIALLSVGTVYGLVQGLGLQPDMVTTIDFQRLNWTDQFAQLPLDPDCPLVYLHSTYPQTVRRWPGPRFVATNASDTTSWIGQYAEPKGSAAQVQTVAHLNVMVALALGANPIILLGQDLSMPEQEHHAAGARAQDMAPHAAPAEAFVPAHDYQGHTVYTRHSFLSMKTVFERLIAEHPDRTFLNCTEGGLVLAGATNVPLAQVVAALTETFPAARGGLRRACRSVFLDYKPAVSSRLAQDWAALRTDVDTLIAFAQTTLQLGAAADAFTVTDIPADAWRAAAAEDCLTVDEVYADLAVARWSKVHEQEATLQSRNTALSLFAIRRFDFLELMAEIPPKEEDVATLLAKAAFNGKRLMRVAHMIAEEAPTVRRLLASVSRRLEMALDPSLGSLETVRLAYAREQYHLGRDALRALDSNDVGPWTMQRLILHYLWHTQQYGAATTMMELWGYVPKKRELAQRYLAQWSADVREAMGAYFMASPPPPTAPGETWVYY